jgi:hypothetical protein
MPNTTVVNNGVIGVVAYSDISDGNQIILDEQPIIHSFIKKKGYQGRYKDRRHVRR